MGTVTAYTKNDLRSLLSLEVVQPPSPAILVTPPVATQAPESVVSSIGKALDSMGTTGRSVMDGGRARKRILYKPKESNLPLLSVSIGNFHAVDTYSLFSICGLVKLILGGAVVGFLKLKTSCKRVSSGKVYLPLSLVITLSKVSSGGVVRGSLPSLKRASIFALARSTIGVAALRNTCSVLALDAVCARSEDLDTVVTTNKVTTKVTKVTVGNTKPAAPPFRCPFVAPSNCLTKRRLMRIGLPILFSHFLNLAINSAKKRLILRLCLESDILLLPT